MYKMSLQKSACDRLFNSFDPILECFNTFWGPHIFGRSQNFCEHHRAHIALLLPRLQELDGERFPDDFRESAMVVIRYDKLQACGDLALTHIHEQEWYLDLQNSFHVPRWWWGGLCFLEKRGGYAKHALFKSLLSSGTSPIRFMALGTYQPLLSRILLQTNVMVDSETWECSEEVESTFGALYW